MDLGGPNTITSYIIIAAYEYFLLPSTCWRIKRFDMGAEIMFLLVYYYLLIINSIYMCFEFGEEKNICVAHEKLLVVTLLFHMINSTCS